MQRFKNVTDTRQWVCLLGGHIIQHAVVNAELSVAILLFAVTTMEVQRLLEAL